MDSSVNLILVPMNGDGPKEGGLAMEHAENPKSFSVLFWNMWFELQNGKRGDGTRIFTYLEELLREHQPDVLGLNEIYRVNAKTESVIERILHSHGYATYFDYLFVAKDGFVVGNVLAYNIEPKELMTLTFAEDSPATDPIYASYRPTVLRGRFDLGTSQLQVFVPHFCAMATRDHRVHHRQRQAFNILLARVGARNAIIGGDFNEPKLTMRFFGIPDGFKDLSGSLFSPTWHLFGNSRWPLYSNLDHILFDAQNNLKIQKFQVLARGSSDHSPLLARFDVL